MTLEMPAHARDRLKGLRSSAHSTGVFTSDFSVNEFLLVRKAGFEPIGLCVGTCVYHVGIQYRSWSKNQELDVLSKAMYHARELAMARMEAEQARMEAEAARFSYADFAPAKIPVICPRVRVEIPQVRVPSVNIPVVRIPRIRAVRVGVDGLGAEPI